LLFNPRFFYPRSSLSLVAGRYRKVDEKLTGWKSRVEESPAYQKTVTTLSDGSKKASGAISNAGTRIK
jgi:hypothetical protein